MTYSMFAFTPSSMSKTEVSKQLKKQQQQCVLCSTYSKRVRELTPWLDVRCLYHCMCLYLEIDINLDKLGQLGLSCNLRNHMSRAEAKVENQLGCLICFLTRLRDMTLSEEGVVVSDQPKSDGSILQQKKTC